MASFLDVNHIDLPVGTHTVKFADFEHTCGTTMCIGGWALVLSEEHGTREIEVSVMARPSGTTRGDIDVGKYAVMQRDGFLGFAQRCAHEMGIAPDQGIVLFNYHFWPLSYQMMGERDGALALLDRLLISDDAQWLLDERVPEEDANLDDDDIAEEEEAEEGEPTEEEIDGWA